MEAILRELLKQRGITGEKDILEFLTPTPKLAYDPLLLKGMKEAVDMVMDSVQKKEKIVVYGDYDADGVTSCVILMTVLRSLGAQTPAYYIPSRFDEGYGLNMNAVEKLAGIGTNLIVTVDCGSVSFEEVERAKELGMKVVVTDHHNCDAGVADTVVINPKQEDCPYPDKNLAGCGVAYKLALALRDRAGLDKSITNDLLDMVAVGTVADVVPLLGENRTLVKYGLRMINRRKRPGMDKLIRGLYGDRLRSGGPVEINAGKIGFGIGPCVNAAGRMGDAKLGVQLFLSDDEEQAQSLAENLIALNHERRSLQEETEKYCLSQEDTVVKDHRFALYIAKDSHEGTNGIVAGKLKERYHMPVAVLSPSNDGLYKASARSTEKIDLYSLLLGADDLFDRFGGHKAACGFSLPEENIPELSEYLEQTLAEMERENPEMFRHEEPYDLAVLPGELSLELAEDLSLMEPFGTGNKEPRFLMKNASIEEVRYMGEEGSVVRFAACGNEGSATCIDFRPEEKTREILDGGGPADIIGTLSVNEFRNVRSPQVTVKSITRSSEK